MQLSVREQGAWRALWVERLILVRPLRVLHGRLVALVLLRACLLLWLLETLSLVLIGAVVVYPALGLVAALSADPAKWGPTILFLMRVGSKLLVLLVALLVCTIFGRHLGRLVAVLLQKRIQVVLVLLVGDGQMRAGFLALLPLLCGAQSVIVLRLIVLKLGVAVPDRRASANAVLLGLFLGLGFLVASNSGGDAAAERLLLGLRRVDGR